MELLVAGDRLSFNGHTGYGGARGWAARARKAAEWKRDRLGKGDDVGPVYLLASGENRPLVARLDQPDLVIEAAGIELDDAAEVAGPQDTAQSHPFSPPALYHRAHVRRRRRLACL